MLAFDIETEHLDSKIGRITVASVYDPDRGIERTFNFIADEAKYEQERDAFIKCLDDAPSLCCFNGVRFDIPFIASRFQIPPEQQGRWILKLFDYFEVCKLGFGSSCSLNNLLKANGEEVKSSSGTQAIEWAKNKEWEPLEEYCMRDTILTHKVSTLAIAKVPLTGWSKQVACLHNLPQSGNTAVATSGDGQKKKA